MNELPDESVHLVVTSPPYWQLKDYGSRKQIGFNDTYEDYINNLNLVWNECHRVLHKGCRLCVNIGDQFARAVYYGRYKVIPIRTEIIKFCETAGFDYMGAIIWQKVTTCNTTGGATIMGSFPYPRNGILKIDYEFILILKKQGTPPRVDSNIKEKSRLTTKEWNRLFAGHWNIPGEKQNSHLAAFPEEVPKRLIRMFSFAGDTVLDPFLGSGTTSLAAKNVDRNSVGYEINRDFLGLIKRKLGISQMIMFDNATFEIVEANNEIIDHKTVINKLPYVFKDPVKFDKKIDPRKLQFGSRIDNNHAQKKIYYRVKQVVSPELAILGNGLKVRLLGVRENPPTSKQAIRFLNEETQAERVFLKFDTVTHDKDNNLLCYMYLENKTFLNARLIKSGLVSVDTSRDYRLRRKFLAEGKNANAQGMDTKPSKHEMGAYEKK